MKKISIFTDGSSLGNPGPGGYGAVIIFDDAIENKNSVVEIGGREIMTTNNRMELMAAIEALNKVRSGKILASVIIYSDSSYVINGITKWVFGWEKNNWINSAKKQVLNQDLWQKLRSVTQEVSKNHSIVWHQIKGHAGVLGNERTDEIATSFAKDEIVELFNGSLSDYETILEGSVLNLKPRFTR